MVVPSPSCPLLFEPQHRAVPLKVSPQLKDVPADIAENLNPPDTGAGLKRVATVRSPSCPLALLPQQYGVWSVERAQLWASPEA